MKKRLLTLVLIMLVCGCVESTIHFFEEEYYMPGFNLSGNLTSSYITAPPLTPVNSTHITKLPKPTLVTGYNHSEEGLWYPLRGTWITPRGNIISYCNFTINKSSLKLYGFSENITVTDTVFDANVSITNSTNIVIAYANITTNINITNLTGFKLIGNNNALYYINETPVSETVINDTIVFSPLVEEPELRLTFEWELADDSNIRRITWNYHYGGKEWKYFTMYNATCKQVTCECAKNTKTPCMAYCLECEELRGDKMEDRNFENAALNAKGDALAKQEEILRDEILPNYTKTTGIYCFKKNTELDLSDECKKLPTKFKIPVYPQRRISMYWVGLDLWIIENTAIQKEYYEHAQQIADILELDLKIFVCEHPFYPVCFCFGDNRKFGFIVAPVDSEEIRAEIKKILDK